MDLAEKHSLFVIEDNAECFLGYYKNRLVGTIGHCASFSFQSSSILPAVKAVFYLLNHQIWLIQSVRFKVLVMLLMLNKRRLARMIFRTRVTAVM